ncbi:MAG TPA: hypothetical protein ENN12_00755 [Epsilonproteobacteria bacterium]|nr:hypothetical protein [Campylobacterota bacterium]
MLAGAYDGEAYFVKDNAAELTATLAQKEVVKGNVFDLIKSDSDVTIDSITIDGIKYTNSLSNVTIDGKGNFTIDFATGEYSYTVKKNEFDIDSKQSFGVKVSDTLNNELEFDVDMHIFTFNPSLIGDADDNEIIYNPTAVIDGGDGYDTLILLSDQEIDFSNEILDVATIANIEVIDMDNDAANSITNLTLDDVLNMTDENNTLLITGDNQDTLNVDTSGWNLVSNSSNNGVIENVYTNGVDSITLRVDDQIISTGL